MYGLHVVARDCSACVVARGCTWLHVVARGCTCCAWCTWLHVVARGCTCCPGCTWLHVVARGCTCCARGCTWLHVVARGCTWLHVVARGCTWLHVVAHVARGCTWLHVVARGCTCLHFALRRRAGLGNLLLTSSPMLVGAGTRLSFCNSLSTARRRSIQKQYTSIRMYRGKQVRSVRLCMCRYEFSHRHRSFTLPHRI